MQREISNRMGAVLAERGTTAPALPVDRAEIGFLDRTEAEAAARIPAASDNIATNNIDQCLNPAVCYCAKDPNRRIVAKNNCAGPGIVSYAPGLRTISLADPELNFRYCEANSDQDEIGFAARKAIAELEHVSYEFVGITGSLLDFFATAASIFGCRSQVKIAFDFPGYFQLPGPLTGNVQIPVDIDADAINPAAVENVVKRADTPLVYLTFPVTNPGQHLMSLELARVALAANDKAIVALDNAYRGVREIDGLARFAIENERSLYINTAAKDLFLASARFGWAITRQPLLAQLLAGLARQPFKISGLSLEQGRRVLAAPGDLRAARLAQAKARDILAAGLRTLGVRTRSGLGPWVLLYFGDEAAEIVRELGATYKIDIQLQTNDLTGWVRISATIPCEASRIVHAMTELLRSRHIRTLCQRLTEQIVSDVEAAIARDYSAAWTPLM